MQHANPIRRSRHVLASILAAMLTVVLVRAGQAADLPSADDIVAKINARDEGAQSVRDMSIELITKGGGQRVRETKVFRKYFGTEKRTAIFYLSPRSVKGTALLTYDYADPETDDDQWLYLPALRKVRRIGAADRGDYFLGTDFTYEDIKKESRISQEDYRHKTLAQEDLDGVPTYKIESIPINDDVAEELGYGRIVFWVDREIWMVRRTEYWDVQGNPLKTVQVGDIRNIQGIWTAHRVEADNHKTGHRTRLLYSNVDYKSGVDDDIFTKRALRRGL